MEHITLLPEKNENENENKYAACGIAAEYNPFHNGHLWHLSRARSKFSRACADADAIIIAVLSANFVQRGLPAFIDKWARTKMALSNGVDLVLELPTFFSCNSGMVFAQGAVDILNAVGASCISFGVEPADADLADADPQDEDSPDADSASRLKSVSCILSQESVTFKQVMKHALSAGASYSKAIAAALEAESEGAGKFASQPNNILALSYLAHINKKNYAISPLPVKRRGDGHNESASKIRDFLIRSGDFAKMNGEFNKDFLPASSAEIMNDCLRNGRVVAGDSKLFEFIRLILLRSEKGSLRKISGMDEGLEGLFAKNIEKAESFGDFIGRCVCARYTRSRLQRQVIKILLGTDKWTDMALQRAGARYVRVLGYNGAGKKYLREASKTAKLDIITKLAAAKDPLGKKLAQMEFRASRLWELLCGSQGEGGEKVYEAGMKPIDYS